MLSAEPLRLPETAAAEAKTYLRVETAEEDGLIGRLMRSAAELCEQFTGEALLARSHEQMLAASGVWTKLGAAPVRAISEVEAVPAEGEAAALPPGSYAIDIDAAGNGWVRLTAPIPEKRIRVRFDAGLASDWNGLPEALRQGMVRLAAHFYAHREATGETADPPAAVAALWRPYRRMRIG